MTKSEIKKYSDYVINKINSMPDDDFEKLLNESEISTNDRKTIKKNHKRNESIW